MTQLVQTAAGYIQFYLSKGHPPETAILMAEHKLGTALKPNEQKAALKLAQEGLKAAMLAQSAGPDTTVGQLFPGVRDRGQKVALRFRVKRVNLTRAEAEAVDASGQRIKVVRKCPPPTTPGEPQRYVCFITTLLPSIPANHPSNL